MFDLCHGPPLQIVLSNLRCPELQGEFHVSGSFGLTRIGKYSNKAGNISEVTTQTHIRLYEYSRAQRRERHYAMTYNAWFQCINGCPGQYNLLEVIYRALVRRSARGPPRHGSVAHRAAAGWIKLFDERVRQNVYPFGSGVWAKKEWVIPFIDNENYSFDLRRQHQSVLG
jgi:hypothetical protein